MLAGYSAAAANPGTVGASMPAPGRVSISATRGVPSVRVPVLSNATTSISPNLSITTADLTSTPCRPASAMVRSGGMVASTTAHGEATIMKVIARSSVSRSCAPTSSGTANSARVATTTPKE